MVKKDKDKPKDLINIKYYTVNQKVTTPTNILKSQKTCGNLGDIHVNNYKENGEVGAGIIYHVSHKHLKIR